MSSSAEITYWTDIYLHGLSTTVSSNRVVSALYAFSLPLVLPTITASSMRPHLNPSRPMPRRQSLPTRPTEMIHILRTINTER